MEVSNRVLDLKEVKPYRDSLPFLGVGNSDLRPAIQPELYRRSVGIAKANEAHIVRNPALNLESLTYTERGKELDELISDAETLFIMGKLDVDGWRGEVERWRKAGGDRMVEEYQRAYSRSGQ